jgi:hypothetical protein
MIADAEQLGGDDTTAKASTSSRAAAIAIAQGRRRNCSDFVKLLHARRAAGPGRRARGCVPLPGTVGYGATVWHPPSDPPPQKYGTWYPGGVRPAPPELRNMKPGISGIKAGIR